MHNVCLGTDHTRRKRRLWRLKLVLSRGWCVSMGERIGMEKIDVVWILPPLRVDPEHERERVPTEADYCRGRDKRDWGQIFSLRDMQQFCQERGHASFGEWTEEIAQQAASPILYGNKMDRIGDKFTSKQGQYLAFIYNYTVMYGRAPSETDLQRFFRTTPPTIHQMILKLEEKGLISRVPGQARSIKLLIDPNEIPRLVPPKRK